MSPTLRDKKHPVESSSFNRNSRLPCRYTRCVSQDTSSFGCREICTYSRWCIAIQWLNCDTWKNLKNTKLHAEDQTVLCNDESIHIPHVTDRDDEKDAWSKRDETRHKTNNTTKHPAWDSSMSLSIITFPDLLTRRNRMWLSALSACRSFFTPILTRRHTQT